MVALLAVALHLPVLSSYSFVPCAVPAVRLRRHLATPRARAAAGGWDWRTRAAAGQHGEADEGNRKSQWILQNGKGMRVLGGPADHAGHAPAARRVNGAHSTRQLYPKPVLDLAMVEEYLHLAGKKEIHAQILYRWLFRHRNKGGVALAPSEDWAFEKLPSDLPKNLRAALVQDFALTTSKVVQVTNSDSGGFKLVIQLQDGHLVETVVIRHEHLSSANVRHTICVSSQVGCAKGCTFCATGTMGFRADLCAGEIVEQLWHAQKVLREQEGENGAEDATIRNVVFMGMGEPLANYPEVSLSLRYLTHQYLFKLGANHITVSTVGDSPEHIRRLADEAPRVRLAVSLHSARQETRHQLMPATIGPDASLDHLASAMDYHRACSGVVAMIEYLLIHGVNDSPEHADALAHFCNARTQIEGGGQADKDRCLLNVIPYNPTEIGALQGFQSPTLEHVEMFRNRLSSLGVGSLVRWTSAGGRDADGACGQLVVDTSPQARAKRLASDV